MRLPALILALALALPAGQLLAQQTGARPSSAANGGGVFGGGGQGGTRSTTSSSSSGGGGSSSGGRNYRNNTMLGDAIVQIDPETRSIIVVADDETQKEVLKV